MSGLVERCRAFRAEVLAERESLRAERESLRQQLTAKIAELTAPKQKQKRAIRLFLFIQKLFPKYNLPLVSLRAIE